MRVERWCTIEAPASEVWEKVSDPEEIARFFDGITRWEVVSENARGLGARYRMLMAVRAAEVGSLIEVVNRFGSFFYGSILGVFLLAMIPFARGWPAFISLLAGMSAVAAVTFKASHISFLWHNVIGALTVLLVGMLLSAVTGGFRRAAPR